MPRHFVPSMLPEGLESDWEGYYGLKGEGSSFTAEPGARYELSISLLSHVYSVLGKGSLNGNSYGKT